MPVSELLAVAVGLGEYKISQNPAEVLVAYGLGSCVGVGVYDPHLHLGGLLHAILPERLNGAPSLNGAPPHASKYVDSGLTTLLEQLRQAGARWERLQVRLVGGAKMIDVFDTYKTMPIGERNVLVAQNLLAARRIKIQAQEVGGNAGRTLRLYIASGRMTVRSMGQPEREF